MKLDPACLTHSNSNDKKLTQAWLEHFSLFPALAFLSSEVMLLLHAVVEDRGTERGRTWSPTEMVGAPKKAG